jgi:NAD-dependent DNA ligase
MLIQRGAVISERLTKAVTVLVVKEGAATKKVEQAERQGTSVLTQEQVLEMMRS